MFAILNEDRDKVGIRTSMMNDKEGNSLLQKYRGRLANDNCPHCQKPIEKKKQIGRSVYALPCYHKLYVGRLKQA
jgi:formamidopyrimidine-DNA glycosylase